MAEYPRELELKDGQVTAARPLEKPHTKTVYKFLKQVPEKDPFIYRLYKKSFESVEKWFTKPSYGGLIQLVSLDNGNIVANGTLSSEGILRSSAGGIKLIVSYALSKMGFSKILSLYGFNSMTDLVIASYNLENWERRFEF